VFCAWEICEECGWPWSLPTLPTGGCKLPTNFARTFWTLFTKTYNHLVNKSQYYKSNGLAFAWKARPFRQICEILKRKIKTQINLLKWRSSLGERYLNKLNEFEINIRYVALKKISLKNKLIMKWFGYFIFSPCRRSRTRRLPSTPWWPWGSVSTRWAWSLSLSSPVVSIVNFLFFVTHGRGQVSLGFCPFQLALGFVGKAKEPTLEGMGPRHSA